MMNNFRNWYVRNQDAITWFIIGWLSLNCVNNLAKGEFIWAAVDLLIIWLNVKLINVRLS